MIKKLLISFVMMISMCVPAHAEYNVDEYFTYAVDEFTGHTTYFTKSYDNPVEYVAACIHFQKDFSTNDNVMFVPFVHSLDDEPFFSLNIILESEDAVLAETIYLKTDTSVIEVPYNFFDIDYSIELNDIGVYSIEKYMLFSGRDFTKQNIEDLLNTSSLKIKVGSHVTVVSEDMLKVIKKFVDLYNYLELAK